MGRCMSKLWHKGADLAVHTRHVHQYCPLGRQMW
jgi:hypothetical protein